MAKRKTPAGHDPTKCGADIADDDHPGKTCGLPAGWGTEHKGRGRCRKHLGNTRNHVIAARRQEIEELAAEMLDDPSALPIEDAGEALRRLATRVEMALDVVGAKVNELQALRYTAAGAGTEQIRGELDIYLRLVKQFESLLTNIARLGLEASAVRVEEQKARLWSAAMRRAFDRMELTEHQWQLVGVVVPEEFRAVAALEVGP